MSRIDPTRVPYETFAVADRDGVERYVAGRFRFPARADSLLDHDG